MLSLGERRRLERLCDAIDELLELLQAGANRETIVDKVSRLRSTSAAVRALLADEDYQR